MQYKSNIIKIIYFLAIISFSISVTIASITTSHSGTFHKEFFVLGALLGPMLSLILLRAKGLYSVCIMLIFVTELTLACANLYHDFHLGAILSNLALGTSITSTLFTSPIITHYLRGPISFHTAIILVITTIFAVFLMANPLTLFIPYVLTSPKFTLVILMLLACNFFVVFSIWKHRLVLLK